MYESEVNNTIDDIEGVPLDVRRRFRDGRDRIASRSLLPWGEHCTECAWPTCYTTCALYTPRRDGGCRLFVDGMVRIDHPDGLSPYLLKVHFKQWGKLWTVGNVHLEPMDRAAAQERANVLVGAMARHAPLPAPIKPRLLRKVNYLRRQSAESRRAIADTPDCFLLECYNPNASAVPLTLTVRASEPGGQPFQSMIVSGPGYSRAEVPYADISRVVDLGGPFEVEIVPNEPAGTLLYFGLMDFVRYARVTADPREPRGDKPLKCIVWDLDNTLWDGILTEDGPAGIRIRRDVLDIIKETDRRGILHSIASKNNHDEAMQVLRDAGADAYFLHPQIHWRPKSESIRRIAELLNVGVESVAFIDDQEFEREEVKAAFPQVEVIDAAESVALRARREFDAPVTAESERRRLMYRDQERRHAALNAHDGDYAAFLRDCQLKVAIRPLDRANLTRVYELAQRTNQLNFSGNRYPEARLAQVMDDSLLETYVFDCSDRFGHYGIVGFAVVDTREPRLLDLMFSCRVQGKRVEHAAIAFLLARFVSGRQRDFHANYKRTPKNAPAGAVFGELGFECAGETDGVSSLVFRRGKAIPDDRIITIDAAYEERECALPLR
jgi:FkbH-like protein